jgi:hypothetical protein
VAAHFWRGNQSNTVAFVFSTPGSFEEKAERPVAGKTGENLNEILLHLNNTDPMYFPWTDRYNYLITNATTTIMHARTEGKKTEETKLNVLKQSNINRLLSELRDCKVVILCGKNAGLLAPSLLERIVIQTPHLGGSGLHNKYPNNSPELNGITSGNKRDVVRLKLCALEISTKLRATLQAL